MNSINEQWQTIHLDVARSHWKELFSTAAIPFLKYMRDMNADFTYYVELHDGHLIFAFKNKKSIHTNIISDFKAFIKSGLYTLPGLEIRGLKGSLTSPFEDHIVNSHQIYPAEELSDIILNVIAAENINAFTTFSLSLSIHMAWIKSRIKTSKESVSSILLKGYSWVILKKSKKISSKLDHEFTQVEPELLGLYNTIMSEDFETLSQLPDWIIVWLQISKSKILNNMTLFFNREYLNEISYYTIPHMINKQLGLSYESILLQMYCINQVVISSKKKQLAEANTSY
jgi:hypothetical protein